MKRMGLVLVALVALATPPAYSQDPPAGSLPSWVKPPMSGVQGPQGRPGGGNNGLGVEPSENVKALSEASNKRQDDLRMATEKLLQVQLDALERLAVLRAEHAKEMAQVRADHYERLAVAEAKRIDAIRAVDVNAVAVASTRATDQATVLAAQVTQSAETIRTALAGSQAAADARLQQLSQTLSARLTTLEQGSYQQAGAKTFQDPAFVDLLKEVRSLSASRSAVGGASDFIGWIFAAIAAIAAGAMFMRQRQIVARPGP